MVQNKVRTTVYLPRDLGEAVKLEALSRGTTMTGVVQEGLRKEIGKKVKVVKKLVWGGFDLGMGKKKWKREWAYEQ